MISVRPDQWEAVVVVLEQCYHFSMASLGAYGIVLDICGVVKPKKHSRSWLTNVLLSIFHAVFLGHSGASGLILSKLICLMDMLLHAACMASDVLLVAAVVRCSRNSVTTRMLESVTCYPVSLIGAIISILYHIAILASYYRRVKVCAPEKPPCSAFVFMSWLRKTLCETLYQPEDSMDSQMPGDTFEVEHTLHTDGICQASFEVSHHPSVFGVTMRHTALTAASAPFHEDDSDA